MNLWSVWITITDKSAIFSQDDIINIILWAKSDSALLLPGELNGAIEGWLLWYTGTNNLDRIYKSLLEQKDFD